MKTLKEISKKFLKKIEIINLLFFLINILFSIFYTFSQIKYSFLICYLVISLIILIVNAFEDIKKHFKDMWNWFYNNKLNSAFVFVGFFYFLFGIILIILTAVSSYRKKILDYFGGELGLAVLGLGLTLLGIGLSLLIYIKSKTDGGVQNNNENNGENAVYLSIFIIALIFVCFTIFKLF